MTAQVHERLTYEGEPMSMAFCPPLPDGHPRIVDLDEPEMDEHHVVGSTANWRGYIGSWEIQDGRLSLVGLVGLKSLVGDEPLFADWFSGVLRIPRGRRLKYVHMGFGSVYEKELHVEVHQGLVVGTRQTDNRGKRHDERFLTWRNLPGFESRFEGDNDPESLERANRFARLLRLFFR